MKNEVLQYKWTWHHTLIQKLKALVYGFYPHLYGSQPSHSYPMQDFTSTCIPMISLSSVSLFHMVVSPWAESIMTHKYFHNGH